MKRLDEQVSLKNKLETITISDFRSRPGEVMDSIRFGKTFVLTKSGKPLAVLSKVPGIELSMDVNSKGVTSYKLPS